MTRTRSVLTIAYSAVFLALCAFALREKDFYLAFAVLGVQAMVFALMPRRSLIAYAASHLPAVAMLLLLCTGRVCWLWVLLALSAMPAGLRLLRRQPEIRPTTDIWVGTLILAEVLAVTLTIL